MEDAMGRCHLCEGIKPIRYCDVCKHYFCADCRKFWWPQIAIGRGWEAFQEKVLGRTRPGCCGEL